jgi:hypothetical protein
MRAAHSEVYLEERRTLSVGTVTELPTLTKAWIGTTIGLVGGIAMALPIVLWDWISESHAALELPMAATAWVFGLEHFTQNGYDWGSIVVGVLLLAGYAIASGAIFGGIADRFLHLRTLPETIGAGVAWGFMSWLFFWYTLLPMAHGGAPFYPTVLVGSIELPLTTVGIAATISVAPIWVFVVAFGLLGVATALVYKRLTTT